MKITAVRTATVRIPLPRPTRISTRELSGRDYVLAWVDTDDGVSGLGFTYAGTVGGRAVQLLIDDALAPLLLGDDPFAIERHWARMYQESLLIGRRGAVLRAISAVDVALWDVVGKTLGQPLYRLIGGYRERVPAYASGGYYRDGDPLARLRCRRGRPLSSARLRRGQDQGRGRPL